MHTDERMEVGFSTLHKVFYLFCWIFLGVLTVFTLPGFIWWFRRTKYPHIMDAEGITTRAGKMHAWRDLDRAIPTRVTVIGGVGRLAGGVRLEYEDGSYIGVVPNMIENSEAVLEFISQRVGEKIESG